MEITPAGCVKWAFHIHGGHGTLTFGVPRNLVKSRALFWMTSLGQKVIKDRWAKHFHRMKIKQIWRCNVVISSVPADDVEIVGSRTSASRVGPFAGPVYKTLNTNMETIWKAHFSRKLIQSLIYCLGLFFYLEHYINLANMFFNAENTTRRFA